MDPDEALRQGREAISDWESAEAGSKAEQEAAERATGAFAALDDWLSHGGFLPADWRQGRTAAGTTTAQPGSQEAANAYREQRERRRR